MQQTKNKTGFTKTDLSNPAPGGPLSCRVSNTPKSKPHSQGKRHP